MNIQEYIASGILEDYTLGLLSAGERKEVERAAAKYPEIQQELNEIEDALTKYAMAQSTPIPKDLTGKIMEKIDADTQETKPGTPGGSGRKLANQLWIVAALGFLVLSGWMYYRNSTLKAERDLLQNDLKNCEIEKAIQQSKPDGFQPRDNEALILKGTGGEERPIAKVFYDQTNATAYLDIIGLDQPNPGKQYQVWALPKNGAPIAVGLVDNDNILNSLINIEYVPDVQGFAISEEDLGGKDEPTPEAILALATFI